MSVIHVDCDHCDMCGELKPMERLSFCPLCGVDYLSAAAGQADPYGYASRLAALNID